MTHRTVPADTARHFWQAFAALEWATALLIIAAILWTKGI